MTGLKEQELIFLLLVAMIASYICQFMNWRSSPLGEELSLDF